MKLSMTIGCQWDKAGGETLQEFKDRYERFKAHVEVLQVKGALPRDAIKWELSINKPPLSAAGPTSPAALNPYETPGVPRFRNGPSFGHVPTRQQREL